MHDIGWYSALVFATYVEYRYWRYYALDDLRSFRSLLLIKA